MRLVTVAALVAISLVGCNQPPTTVQATPQAAQSGNKTIRCTVYYEGGPGSETRNLNLDNSETHRAKFRKMRVRASLQQDANGLRDLTVFVYTRRDGDSASERLVSHLYPFDEGGVRNQAGQGFTGNVYVFHPAAKAQIQYQCRLRK